MWHPGCTLDLWRGKEREENKVKKGGRRRMQRGGQRETRGRGTSKQIVRSGE